MTELFTLKDGSQVMDRRLTRLVQFDERSREFPVTAAIPTGAKPRSFGWPCPKVLDQGPDGACVGFSMAHELIASPSMVKGIGAPFAKEQVYWEAQKIDQWPGGSYPGASPQYEGTSVLAGIKMLKKLGYISEYRWAFGLEDLVLAVGYTGPAIIGIPWYEGMFTPAGCGHVHVTGQVAGGHAILCRGVSVKHKTFTLHNSWGPGWGKKGTALVSWDEMEQLLHQSGEAVIPTVRHKP